MKVFIATHKKSEFPSNCLYEPIQVGAALHDDLGYSRDDQGEHISDKNPNYCELTALYYIWKNRKEDYVGLVHYRRYFFTRMLLNASLQSNAMLDDVKCRKLMEQFDIILPQKYYLNGQTMKQQYESLHSLEDLMKCREIIAEKFPDYVEAFDAVMEFKSIYTYNMFVTSWELFSDYCSWLFAVLFTLEKRIDISNYDAYNQRIFGFLSERLFNVWIEKKHLNIKELPVYMLGDTATTNLKKNVRELLK